MEWIVFALILSMLLAGLNFYFYKKVTRFADRYAPRARRYVPLAFAVMNAPYLLLVGTPIAGRRLHDLPQGVLEWVAYPFFAWITTLLVVLLLTAPKDLLMGLWHGVKWITRPFRLEPPVDPPEERGLLFSRRGFLSAAAAAVPPLVYGVSVHGIYSGHDLEISPEIAVPIPGLPRAFEGLRITQISDLHVGAYIREREMAPVIEAVHRLNGDLLVITGDILDNSLEMLPVAHAAIRRLHAPLGVFGILGNHDYYAEPQGDPGCATIMASMKDAGVEMLRNAHRVLETGGERLILAGVDWTGRRRGNPNLYDSPVTRRALDTAFLGAPAGVPRILLAHHPHVFFEAPHYDVALTLAGHTHGGGQVVVAEKDGRPISIGSGIFRFVSGLYREQDRLLYVNRGIGYVGLPMRINCTPEISRFRLVKG